MSDYPNSYYSASTAPATPLPALKGSTSVDVCVIGAGYTGLSTAIHLAEKGFSVTVLEAERVGWGASGRNGGHVGTGQRQGQAELERLVGNDQAKLLWQYGLDAVATVEALVTRYAIDCDFKQGNLHVAAKPGDATALAQETEHLQQHYQYEQVRYIDQEECRRMVGSQRFYGGLLDLGARHLHPLKFALGLAAAAQSLGVTIYEKSPVSHYEEGQRGVVYTDQGQVHCKHIVLACNGYLGKLEKRIAGKIMPINNFMLATAPLPEATARELIRDDVCVADTLFVINYWKLSGDNRLLFGGGENYTSKFPKDIKGLVRKCMLGIYPQLADTAIDYAWGGTLAITLNRMPHFQRLGNSLYTAQGFSGHGVPTATFAGKVIAEALAGDASKFDVFASVPTPTFPGGTLLRWPGLVAGMLYYSLRDKL